MKRPGRVPGASLFLLVGLALATMLASAGKQPEVRVAPTDSVGPRAVEAQTKASVVRDYVVAWKGASRALEENNQALLDADFVGIAKEKLSDTIQDQQKLGIQTRYQTRKHEINLVFYSPEGMSIQLLDTVEYDVQVLDHKKVVASEHVRTRYLAVLTPTEVRWKVRILQAAPQ